MKNKQIGFLLIFLIAGLYMGMGVCFCFFPYSEHKSTPKTVFDLQNEYAENLEEKVIQLLESTTGPGNVRTSVQAKIIHQDITKETFNPSTSSKTIVREKGPFLMNQSVSVLINEQNKEKLPMYYRVVKAAVGFDLERGDFLVIEISPFKKIPLWTLGLPPLYLLRTGAVLVILIFIGIFWLVKEWIKTSQRSTKTFCFPDKRLWQETERLPSLQLANLLKVKRPEITAFILHQLDQGKAAEIIDLLPPEYMSQIVLHLKYVEKLNFQDRIPLLQETEGHLKDILKAVSTCASYPHFDKLKNWSDEDIQDLLHYVSKQDLIKAIQNTSLEIQNIFTRNIPPTLWQSLIQKAQLNPCSKEQSLQAQEKIMRLAQLLKKGT